MLQNFSKRDSSLKQINQYCNVIEPKINQPTKKIAVYLLKVCKISKMNNR